jgi:putative transposase
MARIARLAVPGFPHHVTQRGNRRIAIFDGPDDYALYRDLIAERCRANNVACWAYCLMPNHVHLILVPSDATGMSRAVGEAHRRYTAFYNARARVTGHLFQSRFNSVVMDEEHLLAAARYLALNPLKARLVKHPQDWPHSSVRAHLAGKDNILVTVAPLLYRVPTFADLIELTPAEELAFNQLETKAVVDLQHDLSAVVATQPTVKSKMGLIAGSQEFIERIEAITGLPLKHKKRGPKRQSEV